MLPIGIIMAILKLKLIIKIICIEVVLVISSNSRASWRERKIRKPYVLSPISIENLKFIGLK